MIRILVAEDEPLQRRTLVRMLTSEQPAEVLEAADGAEALLMLKTAEASRISLALIDLGMPTIDGLTLLKAGRKLHPELPFIVLTASENVGDAVTAMQLGAVDFINKPPEVTRLMASVRNALALKSLQEEVVKLQQDRSPHYTFDDLTAISPALKDIGRLGQKVARSDIPVLITGESGVGKEVIAHAMHLESERSNKPFISVNCGALPENLVESTLFGHEKGAFTGATSRSIGKCREAQGGVLFLDEVGELKPDAQVKLLRLLQEGEIEPVGASKPVKVDVRVISATNRSLEDMVAQGRFREDLYYRLHGVPLLIPPLRERRRDIVGLAEHLLKRISLTEGRPHMSLSEEAKEWLTSYRWPGNVRELQHVLSRAALLSEQEEISGVELSRWAKDKNNMAAPAKANDATTLLLQKPNGQFKTLTELEEEIFEAALIHHRAHIGRAAAALGIGQSTLYKRMRKNSA